VFGLARFNNVAHERQEILITRSAHGSQGRILDLLDLALAIDNGITTKGGREVREAAIIGTCGERCIRCELPEEVRRDVDVVLSRPQVELRAVLPAGQPGAEQLDQFASIH
jgi:hypothetical protein